MALKEGCYNRIAERNGRIYLFQHEAPLAEGLNPLVFPDIHEYKRFVEQQLMSGGECRVLRVRKTRYRHPEEK